MSQFWAIYKKVDFFQLLCPLLLLFAPFGRKYAFFQKSDNNILNIFWYYIFMQKNKKKRFNGSKDIIVIWKSINFWNKYCRNLHPFLGVKECRDREKIVHIKPKVCRAIQIWNQIFKIFSSCVGYHHIKNIS